jgi:hypothetical protein
MSEKGFNFFRAELLATAGLVLVLALAAYLRLANNVETPGWYTDEGTHLEIAQHLAQGRMQYMAINQSTFLFAKLPLFDLLLAGWLTLAGGGIGTLRTLTGVLGVISVATLYGVVGWTTKDIWLAFLAALILAIYPQAVLYSRFGFSYNLLAPLVLLAYLGLWQYMATPSSEASRRGWLVFTALVVGLGGISDLWMFMLAAPVLVVVLARRWRDALWTIPLLFLPLGLYLSLMLLATPEAFWFDLGFTASRLSRLSLPEQLDKLAANYTVLITQDQWLAVALVGLFLLRPERLQLLAWLLLLTPIILLGRTEALYHLSFYYMIPLLPLISLGMAVVLRWGVPYAGRQLHRALLELLPARRLDPDRKPANGLGESPPSQLPGRFKLPDRLVTVAAYAVVLALAATPFLTTTATLVQQTHDGFTTAIDPFLIKPKFARYIANFVNRQTAADDLVIASPGLAWMFQARTADFQMALAFTGQATPHLPANLPPERFAFSPDYTQARFVVVDNLWHTWAVFNVSGVDRMLETLKSWRIAFQSGDITVYCNPVHPEC